MLNPRPDGPPTPTGPQPDPDHPVRALRRNPYELLDQADDVHARISGLQAALDHHERLATLGTIAGLIAHEFNNILTPVMSYAQMALAKPDDRELATKALTKAVEGTERAASIAAAILGFTRDESLDTRPGRDGRGAASDRGDGVGRIGGRMAAHSLPDADVPRGTSGEPAASSLISPPTPTARCDVQSVIEETFACMAREPRKDGIEVDVYVEPGLEAAARPVTLQHVMLNLILNARNAMIPAGGRLTIRAHRAGECPRIPTDAASSLEADGGGRGSTWNIEPRGSTLATDSAPGRAWVVVEVSDNGRGMSPEQLRNLFRPFYTTGIHARDHSRCCGLPNCDGSCRHNGQDAGNAESGGDRRERRTGTGLGMTICKRLLADCGGVLHVRSAPGSGTTAVVAVPAVS